MGTTRKLQSEIDRTLKKVQEGVELFDEIWNKVYSATNANQKEKYEGDLKKEIKKLQRYRDDIKTWIAKSDIKDKRPLMDARKAIEAEMERFKVCEKEFKTKAFSKEGLGQARKEDPKEVERNKTRKWLTQALATLNDQIDAFEAEIEAIGAQGKGGKGKSSRGKSMDDLDIWVEKHRLHERRMEQILRMIDNESLESDAVNAIQDQLEYYLESNQDADFAEDEALYDELGLDDLPAEDESDRSDSEDEPEPETDKKAALKEEKALKLAAAKEAAAAKLSKKQEQAAKDLAAAAAKAAAAKALLPVPAAATVAGATVKPGVPVKPSAPVPASPVRPAKAGAVPPTAAAVVAAGVAPLTAVQMARAAAAARVQPGAGSNPSAAAALSGRREAEEKGGKQAPPPTGAQPQPGGRSGSTSSGGSAEAPTVPPIGNSWGVPLTRSSSSAQPVLQPAPPPTATPPSASLPPPPSVGPPVPSSASMPLQTALRAGGESSVLPPASASEPASLSGRLLTAAVLAPQSRQFTPQNSPGMSASLHPTESAEQNWVAEGGAGGLGASAMDEAGAAPDLAWMRNFPAGHMLPQQLPGSDEAVSASASTPLSDADGRADDKHARLRALTASLRNIPDLLDSERPKTYVPRNPYPTPGSFPQTPAPVFDLPATFEQFDTDALFFIFYYQQGTYQQYLAARELKKQSWRYHKKYLTWFQRHEEPKVTTDEYEQGTYIYFDYETGWCQRIKTDFTFEYGFLEDELNV